ncbi:MAG: MFS transporter [Rhizomicrobium sp.]
MRHGCTARPILGGLLADRVLGRTRTVILGASLMAAGQFFMMTDETFLIAISCLLVGVGCFKGNIASQVGDLYTQDDPRRADGFQIYFLGIQIAVIVAPFVCSSLGEKVDWRLGFGAAGIAMIFGLITYLSGRKNYPPEAVRVVAGHEERPKASTQRLAGHCHPDRAAAAFWRAPPSATSRSSRAI